MRAAALEREHLELRGAVEVARIRLDDAGGRALLVAGPAPATVGIVVAHGGWGPGAHIFVDEAVELAGLGAAVVLPEVTFPTAAGAAEHDAAIEAAIALQRRAVDVLEGSLGARRFGFFGHSAGGAQGAILSTVEPRLEAIVVAGAGARLLSRLREQLAPSAELDHLTRWDPEHWVGADNGRALLVQHGLRDDVVPLEDARRLYAAAAGRKEWAEYDCGHGIDADERARADRLAFFARELGL